MGRVPSDVEKDFRDRNSRAKMGERHCSCTSFFAYPGKRGMKGLMEHFIWDAGYHARPLGFIPSSEPRLQGQWIFQG